MNEYMLARSAMAGIAMGKTILILWCRMLVGKEPSV